jgi:hypothetical protein
VAKVSSRAHSKEAPTSRVRGISRAKEISKARVLRVVQASNRALRTRSRVLSS